MLRQSMGMQWLTEALLGLVWNLHVFLLLLVAVLEHAACWQQAITVDVLHFMQYRRSAQHSGMWARARLFWVGRQAHLCDTHQPRTAGRPGRAGCRAAHGEGIHCSAGYANICGAV